MIEQQLDLQGVLVQMSGGEGVDALPECGSGDRARVDWVGLPAGSLGASFSGGQVGRDPQDALPCGYEEPLEGAGEVPAVLDRPYPFGVWQAAGPVGQLDEPVLARGDRLVVQELSVGGVDGGEGVGVLVYVRSDQDHSYRPFIIGSVVWADRWLTRVTWGVLPRSYQVKPAVLLGRRRATQQRLVRPPRGRLSHLESARRLCPRHPTPPAGQHHRRQPGRARMTVTLSWPSSATDLTTQKRGVEAPFLGSINCCRASNNDCHPRSVASDRTLACTVTIGRQAHCESVCRAPGGVAGYMPRFFSASRFGVCTCSRACIRFGAPVVCRAPGGVAEYTPSFFSATRSDARTRSGACVRRRACSGAPVVCLASGGST